MSSLPTLDEFLERSEKRAFPSNSYVKEPGWESLYVRYGPRFVLEDLQSPVLTLANITVEKQMRGKGVFTTLVERLRREHPNLHLLVENTHSRFGSYLLKIGFVLMSEEISKSYFLKAKESP